MLKSEIVDFIRNTPPFDLLSDAELRDIAEGIVLEYYPGGEKILRQDGAPSRHLCIIKKGGVKIYRTDADNVETIIDYRSEGEQFGMLSLISGDRSRNTVLAVEDTICYLIPGETVLDQLQHSPAINEYFLKSFFVNQIDKTYEETRKRFSARPVNGQLLFSTPVQDIVQGRPVCADHATPIREGASLMAFNKISSLVVTDIADKPVGMVTDRDLREKVVARGLDVALPLESIMSSNLIAIDSAENCFEALMRMIRHKIHHILVMRGDQLLGLVSNHDFMLLQGASPTVLVKQIGQVRSVADLKETMPQLHKAVATLLRFGARSHNITGLITELAETITSSIVQVIEGTLGPAPVPHALFMFGDSGRRELFLDFRIQFGIVYPDEPDPDRLAAATGYFQRFAAELNRTLAAGNMTGTGQPLQPDHIRSHSGWRDYFHSWGTGPGTGLEVDFFDIRPVRGDASLVEAMRDILRQRIDSYQNLLHLVAAHTVNNQPPLGFFKHFVVEKSGEHRNELDLYAKGYSPLTDCVRTYALANKLEAISSGQRLERLKKRHLLARAEEVNQALTYLGTLIIHNQLLQLDEGIQADTFVNPDSLTGFERKTLKEAFQLITTLHEEIEAAYWGDGVVP